MRLPPPVLLVLACLLLFTETAVADYGWIPRHETLIMRIGGTFLSSTENFNNSGLREDITFQNQTVKITENRLTGEAEYGFAPEWSGQLNFGFGQTVVNPSPSSSGSLLVASGFGEVRLAIKKNFRKATPVITLETYLNFPTNGTTAEADELLPGDGAFDLGLIGHTGIRIGALFLALSPGFVTRSSGYASAFTMVGAIGGSIKPVYGYLFLDWYASLGDALLNDSSLDVHDANGTGGSYLRLSGSPTLMHFGLKVGARLFQSYGIEVLYKQGMTGNRAPNYSMFGINFRAVFDFFEPDKRTRIREVPFDKGRDTYLPDG